MLRVLLVALIMSLPRLEAARAREPTLIRCIGYTASLVMMTGQVAGEYQPPEPFDLFLDLQRGRGWFRGFLINERNPGRLIAEATSYTITAEGRSAAAQAMTEWAVLDRVGGELRGHYIQFRSHPVERLKWSGTRQRLERRF